MDPISSPWRHRSAAKNGLNTGRCLYTVGVQSPRRKSWCNPFVLISVLNRGPSTLTENLRLIFDPFHQGKSDRKVESQGVGIGLSPTEEIMVMSSTMRCSKVSQTFVARAAALALLMAGHAAAAEIPAGTHVLLRMVNSISTRTAQPGDYVYMRTASPISVDGVLIVPINSYVQGVVTAARRAGRVTGKAEMALRLETLTLPRGRVLRFAPRLDSVEEAGSGQRVDKTEDTVRQGPGHGSDATRILVLAGGGASLGAIVDRSWTGAGIGAGVGAGVGIATVMLTRGREVELRQGSSLDVVLDRAVSLEADQQ